MPPAPEEQIPGAVGLVIVSTRLDVRRHRRRRHRVDRNQKIHLDPGPVELGCHLQRVIGSVGKPDQHQRHVQPRLAEALDQGIAQMTGLVSAEDPGIDPGREARRPALSIPSDHRPRQPRSRYASPLRDSVRAGRVATLIDRAGREGVATGRPCQQQKGGRYRTKNR